MSGSSARNVVVGVGLGVVLLLVTGATRAQEPDPQCPFVYDAAAIEELFTQLREGAHAGPCELIALDTDRAISRAEYALPDGQRVTVVLAPSECFDPEPRGALGAVIPDGFEARCPSSGATLDELVLPATTAVGPPDVGPGDERWTLPRAWAGFAVSLMLFAVAFVAARALRRLRRTDRSILIVAAAGFSFALVVRAFVPFAMANWNADYATAGGAYLSTLLPWDDAALATSAALLGSLHVPLVVALLHSKGLGIRSAAVTAVLLALDPYHVRISTSASEHVLIATCILGAIVLFERGCKQGLRLDLIAAFLLVACATAVRAESLGMGVFVPLFAVLHDRGRGTRSRSNLQRMLRAGTVYYVALGILAWGEWNGVIVPSSHAMPSSDTRWDAVAGAMSSLFDAAEHESHYVATTSAYLFLFGLLAGLRWRPRLMVAVGLFVFGSCFVFGRHFYGDELLGARPLMAASCILHIPGGVLVGRALQWSERRVRSGPYGRVAPVLLPVALVGLAIVTAAQVWPAYERRYTFEDEYDFLHRELSNLPDGCVVYQLSPRAADFGRDLDCCLDAEHSPLVLAHPQLRFRTVAGASIADSLSSEQACAAYYESAMCSLHRTSEVEARFDDAVGKLETACSIPHEAANLELISEANVTPVLPRNFFQDWGPRVHLFRVSR